MTEEEQRTSTSSLVVVSRYHPGEIAWTTTNNDHHDENEIPILSDKDRRNDGWDEYNHPRYRRACILTELAQRILHSNNELVSFVTPLQSSSTTTTPPNNLHAYLRVHSPGLIEFLETSWQQWDALKDIGGQDPASSIIISGNDNEGADTESTTSISPPLIPGNTVFPRSSQPQRPSKNVMGQIGYYCTDTCTPIFDELLEELKSDLHVIQTAVAMAVSMTSQSSSSPPPVVYALATHPGHHAANDCFGGYCYVNHAALAARLLQEHFMSTTTSTNSQSRPQQQQQQQYPSRRHGSEDFTVEDDDYYESTTTTTTTDENDENADRNSIPPPKVAILDVDYHCGNGTASIFYDDPSCYVVSIHCHPDHEYPFHSGFDDERGGDGTSFGTTLHLPLLPGATWEGQYQPALQKALNFLFGEGDESQQQQQQPIQALVVSLGLDTLQGDPCAIRRAGFNLTTTPSSSSSSSSESDFLAMGRMIGEATLRRSSSSSSTTMTTIPCVVVQEGGYKMKEVPNAAADVLTGIVEGRSKTTTLS